MDKTEQVRVGSENQTPNETQKVLGSMPDFNKFQRQSNYFEENPILDADEAKKFQELLKDADVTSTEEILQKRLKLLEQSSTDKTDIEKGIHEGYISQETAVHFQIGGMRGIGSSYKIRETDYIYDFVEDLQRNREKVPGTSNLLLSIEPFLNSYFGYPPSTDTRADYIDDVVSSTDNLDQLSDEEWWGLYDNIDISVFKGQELAMCTERAAMAQNILCFLGFESYYVSGNVETDGIPTEHAFNIITNPKNNSRYLLDFSITSSMEHDGFTRLFPTMIQIQNYEEFLQGKRILATTSEGRVLPDGTKEKRRTHTLKYGL